MNKKNNGRSTDGRNRSVSNIQKNNNSEKEAIFREVTINLNNTEYNQKKERSKKKKKKHKIIKALLILILVGFIAFAGLFIKRMNENGWTMGGFVATILGHNANTLSNLSRLNILVVGQSQSLTDTLMVCTYDPKTQDVGMLSIPRDTFVGRNSNYATGSDKINALYQSNPDKLLAKVNEITGLDIKYYIKVDTKGFRDLIDSIGGIYFDVPIDMDYEDPTQDLYIHLKAGYQLLDGDKAEQVVRFRHNSDGTSYSKEYGDQDLGRMRTQREFITQVIKQLAKAENITKIDDFIKIANNNIESNFSLWNIRDYAPYALDIKTDNIKTATLPGAPEKFNNLWFYSYNKKKTEEIVNEIFKTELTEEQEKNASIKINILNGTNEDANLENLKMLLKESGYTVVSTGKTTATQTTTIINRTNKSEEVANELKETVGVGIVSNSNNKNSEVDFTIIIGGDY